MAVLSLLAEAAESRPLLCVVGRRAVARLGVERGAAVRRPVGSAPTGSRCVFAAREGDVRRFDGTGIPELVLRGLDGPAALAVLSERAGRPVAAQVRDELVRRTSGNPLALVELPGC